MAIGRISGPLLKANLVRNGIDLAFETDLLYLDVNNNRIGVKTTSPQYELDVNGTTRTTNLIVTNRADIGSVNIEGNTISSDVQYLNLGTFDNVIYQNKLRVDSIDIEGNVISTNNSNANLEFRPNGTGSVEVYADMNVIGNIHATGNISADGSITLGNEDTDDVVFNAKVASDIIPNLDITYNLGSSDKRWNDVWVRNIVTDGVNADDLVVDGIDLVLRQGKIWYVATNGNDDKFGNHPQDPFATLGKALSVAQPGDSVYLYPGVYAETFPLTVPVGVTVKGHGIRAVKVVPTLATQNNDAFLLNGETTVENLTVADFYSPGYAFRFAPNFKVTTRSPYIKDITVITKGSTVTLEDPRGFAAGDAGQGVFLDGSIATSDSQEASGLFHSVTFITPGVDAVVLTNGVRVEWLNCFTYFANRSIFAEDGATGLKGTGQTALRFDNISGTITAGETVTYYDTDGTTVLASATIASIDSTGKVFLSGKQTDFETAQERGGKTISAFGNAKLSTAEKKFGSASLALDGVNGSYAGITAQNDFGFGTSDFTIEGHFYFSSTASQWLWDFRAGAAADVALNAALLNSGNTIRIFQGGTIVVNTNAAGIATNTWYHIAVSRNNNVTKLFIDGIEKDSQTDNYDYGSTKPLVIGATYTGTSSVSGFIDDLRIVKGTAVYTTNFTPPVTRLPVTPETVLMARFDGENDSTVFLDDVVYDQDVRFSGGATANRITLTDFTDFGAEVRLIGSASVYGNFGLVGDGPGVIMYAIGHNLAYVGNGKEVTNDPATVIQANEVVETNNAKIRYTSVDHKGDFRVGDLFYVNQDAGTVNFTVSDFTINTTGGITFTDGASSTFIDGTKIETGNWRISGNTVETLSGDANFEGASGEINLNSNVNISGNLDVTGNVTIGGNITIGDEESDTIQIIAGISSDIVPRLDSVYSLGTADLTWSNLWVNEINVDDIQIRDNYITTTASNSDLELRASGTGVVLVPSNDVKIDNNLTVDGTTTLDDTFITGTVELTGDFTQTGDYTVTGNVSIGQNLTVGAAAQFEEIRIENNVITTTTGNTDLILQAAGTGNVLVPNNDVVITNDLTVVSDIAANNIDITAKLTSNDADIGDIIISGTTIQAVASNADLELRANGTGEILVPSNDVVLGQDLTVLGSTDVQDLTVTGTVTHLGDVVQTGNYIVDGSFTNGNITIDANVIATTQSNSDLELRASSAGVILIPSNNVTLGEDLSVLGSTDVQDLTVVGTITHTGDVVQTGNFNITGEFTNGNISINSNTIATTQTNSNLELRASGTGAILVPNNNVTFSQNLTVSGSTSLQDVEIFGTITHVGDVIQTGNFNIAGEFTNGNILIEDNFISTTDTNSDLELRASGTGTILVPSNNVVINNDLTVSGDTDLQDTTVTGTITHVGNAIQTGNFALTGDFDLTGDLTVSGYAQFEDVRIENNTISTTQTNSDLELSASGTGIVIIPNNNVEITNDLTVDGTITVGAVTSSGTITANRFSTGDILIDDNFITTTTSNSNLELRANGTGTVLVPSNDVVFGQDLTVLGDTSLQDTQITGTLDHTGNVVQTGNIDLTGDLGITGTVTVSSTAQFEDVRISGNTVTTTQSNSNLELSAEGIVIVPNNNVQVTGELTVLGEFSVGAINSSGTIQANNFTTGDILIDDNFITTTTSNSNLELRASGTGSIIIDDFDIKDSTISSSNDIVLAPGSQVLVIDATGALRLPVGTTAQRPTAQAGQIRFNSELARYEGYNGTNWIQLHGVVDLDGDTRVTAELTEGANDNTIRFDIAGSTLVDVDSTRLSAHRVVVDSIQLDDNVISTVTANSNLVLSPSGTGRVIIDNFAIRNNTITNTAANSVTNFVNTADGYVKFDGTYGLVLPAGTTSQRPPPEFSEVGMTRFNTTDARMEVWSGVEWISVAGAEAGISRSDAENIAFEIVLSLG
jgi:hypothetical protein